MKKSELSQTFQDNDTELFAYWDILAFLTMRSVVLCLFVCINCITFNSNTYEDLSKLIDLKYIV